MLTYSVWAILANVDVATIQGVKLIASVNFLMQLHIFVSGHVQGVGFRDFARRSAERFEIRGFTKNLANGDVKIVAEGAKEPLDKFIFSLEKGPPAGRVDCIRIDERMCGGEYTGFEIRF